MDTEGLKEIRQHLSTCVPTHETMTLAIIRLIDATVGTQKEDEDFAWFDFFGREESEHAICAAFHGLACTLAALLPPGEDRRTMMAKLWSTRTSAIEQYEKQRRSSCEDA